MACKQTPTATLFGESVISSLGVSTLVQTDLQTVVIDGISLITTSTCVTAVPPVIIGRRQVSCRQMVITSRFGSQSVRTNLITTVQTVTVVQTVTSPTQTLFTTSCGQDTDPITTPTTITEATTTSPSVSDPLTSTPTSTSSSSSKSSYIAPVTLTSTLTSTDLNGNVFTSTFATVSTPSPDSAQSGSGGGGPNTPAIIGGVVGGVVALLALIGIIWFILYKKLSGGHGGHWDDTWEEDQGHQAGAAEVKHGRPAAADNGSSPNPYVYGVVGRGSDQPSGVHSHSRSTSITGYADHGRSSSQTPLMLATSPPHSPPNSPPSLQQHTLPGLERRGTPVWASASAQQGYFHQGYPPISSDPNFTPTVTSAYNATSRATSAYLPPPHTAANPTVAYPPGAAPPVIGGPRSTNSEYHKPPLELSQHGAARQPSQREQTGPSGSTTKLVEEPSDNSADSLLVAAGLKPGHTPSIKDRNTDKGGLNGAPTSKAEPPRVVEDAPPAYAQ